MCRTLLTFSLFFAIGLLVAVQHIAAQRPLNSLEAPMQQARAQGLQILPPQDDLTRNLTGSYQFTTSQKSGSSGERIRFSFSGYGNPQRPFPGYVGPFQLGPVSISGSGEIRASDGALLSGGRIGHSDNLRDRNYPNHSTTWQVIRGLGVQRAGGRTTLRLQVQVVSSNYTRICPVGTLGIIDLIDDNRRLPNGQTNDGILTQTPNPSSVAPSGGAACGTHTHGMNNTDVSWTDPPRGGPSGGMWANVEISGGGSSGARGCSDLTGRWANTIPEGRSTWEITRSRSGGYQAVEIGMGNARSTAVTFTGNILRIDWVTGGLRGYYQWQLDAQCQQSTDGLLVWTQGASGTRKTTLRRQ